MRLNIRQERFLQRIKKTDKIRIKWNQQISFQWMKSNGMRSQTTDFDELGLGLCDDNSDEEEIDVLYRHLLDVWYQIPCTDTLKACKLYIFVDFIGGNKDHTFDTSVLLDYMKMMERC